MHRHRSKDQNYEAKKKQQVHSLGAGWPGVFRNSKEARVGGKLGGRRMREGMWRR